MDGQAVEEPLARQRDEILDRQRRVEHRQLDLNRAAIGVDERLRRERRIDQARRRDSAPASAAPARAGCRVVASLAGSSSLEQRGRATRTAQSLSASAVVSTGVAAAAP